MSFADGVVEVGSSFGRSRVHSHVVVEHCPCRTTWLLCRILVMVVASKVGGIESGGASIPLAVSEQVMNFINQKCWKKVPCPELENLRRKIMKTMWAFKVKDEQDGSLPHKSRVCSKGYQQIPGIDYKESFLPVAMDMMVRIILCIYLYHAQGKDGLMFACEMINIEAAFLEGDMTSDTFIDWPQGMLELRFATQRDQTEFCSKLIKSMYGNVDAALRFFKTYLYHWTYDGGMKQLLADPCVFQAQ
jgi:hypothetical protein